MIPLPVALAGYLLALVAFWALVCARGYQGPPAGTLRSALGIEWRVPLSLGTHLTLFAVLALTLVAGWVAAVRAVPRADIRIRGVLGATLLLAVPMVLLTAIYSDDVYLYNMYGREIALYRVNPIITAPSAFPADPHLAWVYWQWLPSSYGPLWLAISAPISAAAGQSINAAILLYRCAALIAHLVTVWIIWRAAGAVDPRRAVPAAAFFAWNPLVLFESAASAHNDAFVVAFVCGAVWTWAGGRTTAAAALVACAAMVKPFAAILLVPLAVAAWARTPGPGAAWRICRMAGAAVATALVLYAPFWAGDTLLRNIVSNPAAGVYMNTPWELAAAMLSQGPGLGRTWLEVVVFDRARVLVLGASFAASVIVALRTGEFVASALVLWVGFCWSQAWIWPWYFLPIAALAAVAGSRAHALAVAFSAGGLLFYLGWPPPSPALGWIYAWRAALLFGPAAVVLCALAARRLAPRPHGQPESDPVTAAAPGSPSASP